MQGMGHLYRYHIIQLIRDKNSMFWGLIFPILLGTLFYATFGTSHIEQMKTIPVAVVSGGNAMFENFLDGMDGIVEVQKMDESEALDALQNGTLQGIFYSKAEPSLTVSSTSINESILNVLLQTYVQNQTMMKQIGEHDLLALPAAAKTINDYRDLVTNTDISGNEIDDSLTYFFALIGMACLFGSFSGASAAQRMIADQSALAVRQNIVPTHRLKLIVSQMLTNFSIQFFNICVLLCYLHFCLRISFGKHWSLLIPVCILGSMAGVAIGILTGSLRAGEGVKMVILVGGSLIESFLAGLMYGNMKDIVEHHLPILNRLNVAALISDAFYSISVYENLSRYRMNLGILAVITAGLVYISYRLLRRMRYDCV